jgi:uncharacterized protein (TIGR02646 family)
MRKLDRTSASAPVCLSCYQHGKHNWGDVQPAHKDLIRESLEEMQGRRCAYCEGPVDALGQHIEHFRTKHTFPSLTFDWKNLYWSCDQADSCGRHKDHDSGPYDPNDLIDPCREDPDRFFRFRSDGTIQVRTDITDNEQHRARETLRVFNLNPTHGRLRQMRKRALEAYRAQDPDILEALETFESADREVIIAGELARTSSDPFSAVIRHFFERVA